MTTILLQVNWLGVLLSLFTIFLVISDRAFSKKIRLEFLCALIASLVLTMMVQHLDFSSIVHGSDSERLIILFARLIRPFILWMMVLATDIHAKVLHWLAALLYGINFIFAIAEKYTICSSILCIYIVFLFIVFLISGIRTDRTDHIFAFILVVSLLITMASEFCLKNFLGTANALCLGCSVEYFYLVMRTYKKDGLTGLLIRHNLNYEMADLQGKEYDIVLIDVDNFKLINDKYGHDKGDEALVSVVNATKKNLPKACRMFRFGGDEFVIISRKVSRETLEDALNHANQDLAMEDLHMSFGVVHHSAGEDGSISLTEADKVMYENKRFLKSEDIWDDMTGLFNYRGFLDEMESFRKKIRQTHHVICLLGVDVERLNNINMAYGYTEGNLVISTLARILKKSLRGRDFIGHLGSDEFVVAIDCEDENDPYITSFISEIQEGMDSAYEFANKEYTVRINVSKKILLPQEDVSSEEYVNEVLYLKQEEKENRRKNDVGDGKQDYNEQDEKLVLDILDNNKLTYAFQPIVSAKNGSIVAYECLMRSTTETMVSPLKILKYAEKNNRLYDVERFTFFNAFSKIASMENVPENVRFFVNSMPGHFMSPLDYDILRSRYGNWFSRIVVEITEQREISDESLSELNMRRDADGFQLAIDDYGSGCSNTNNLLRYMPQIVKLDRLLITGIDRNAKKKFFVSSIISFARENDLLILAEGVETENELKTVIRLGVDLIQGYITAKPSLELLDKIPEKIERLIINQNLKVESNQRNVYTAGSSCDLSVVNLAMEDYSKLNVAGEFITLSGNAEYSADMVIRVKEGIKCHMTLKDVCLNSVDGEPCIALGEGTTLTLNLEGMNKINGRGIYVPEGSVLNLIGPGNIEVSVKGHQCFGIGSDTESGFGQLVLRNSGYIKMNVDGEECVGIGGGITGDNSEIILNSGTLEMNVAGVNAVGIGAYKGNVPIDIRDCEIHSVFRVNHGSFIGVLEGEQNINIQNYIIQVSCSGTEISCIGSYLPSTGVIRLNSGTYENKSSGHKLLLLGTEAGDVDIQVSHSNLKLIGEGDIVLGIGSNDANAKVDITECGLDLIINASSPTGFGTKDKHIEFIGPTKSVMINGVREEI